MGSRRPILHIVAGPNGAGKSTLYEHAIKGSHRDAEFVNADVLAWTHYGHPASTLVQSRKGQQLAEARRVELMAERKSLVTETTFSHPSKLQLMRDAREAGFELRLYHVNVRSPELSVLRVAQRVSEGGHPVPEDKIRERYVRNQDLIREAVRMADKALVFDNSRLGQPHMLTIEFQRGEVVRVGPDVPAWARDLYADDLARFKPRALDKAAASFDQARATTRERLGDGARTYIARPGGRYTGPVLAETARHVVQQIGSRSAVAHFKDRLASRLAKGQRVRIVYPVTGDQPAAVNEIEAKTRPGRTVVQGLDPGRKR